MFYLVDKTEDFSPGGNISNNHEKTALRELAVEGG